MPPWIIPELAPDAPQATSFFSSIRVLSPRIAASRAIPVPFTPPPITIRSNWAEVVIPWEAVTLLRRRSSHFQVELAELPLIDLAGRAGHQIDTLLSLRKWDDVAQ